MELESYKMEFWDMSKLPEDKPVELKEWEIWLGYYHLGQGYDPPKEPELVGKVKAPTFRIACYLFVLESSLNFLKGEVEKYAKTGRGYIEDIHFGKLGYHPETNSSDWIGKYYETREEALQSFK